MRYKYGYTGRDGAVGNRKMIRRRSLLVGVGSVAMLAGLRWMQGPDVATAGAFEVERSDAEWRQLLNGPQYAVLRKHGTEQPFSSALEHEKRQGMFACAGCDLPLFSSETKFDSGTG